MNTSTRKFAKILLFLAIGCGALALERVPAQDVFGTPVGNEVNEFAADGVVSQDSKGDVTASRLSPNERSAVVRSLRMNPPRSAAELAKAIQLTARIRRWDEVGHWLDELKRLGVDETKASQMVQAVGTETFLSLVVREADLTEDQRGSVQKILDLANASASDPTRLRTHVLALLSQSKSERVQGFRALESAGHRGVKALIDYLLSEQAVAPNATMAEAFSLMGNPAFLAWQAAMLTSDARARGRLALLAARLGEPSLALDICTVANDNQVPEQVRQSLQKVVADRNKTIPNGAGIFRHAIDQLQQTLKDYQRIRWSDEADSFLSWQLSSDGRSVVEQPARESDLRWARAVQLASLALRSSAPADIESALAVAVQLEDSAKKSAGTSRFEEVAIELPATIRDSYEFGCLIWDAAEGANLASAQLLAIKNLARWVMPSTMPNAVRDRLSRAAKSGYGPVRYEAASSLLRALYAGSEEGKSELTELRFDGRNWLERILSEMRNLEGRPLALVVGGNSELKTHTRELLEAFSYRVIETSSASQTMGALRDLLPIESIFIVDKVLEMDLGQLVQRIRANPSTASCPIAILAASLSRGEHSVATSDTRVVMGSVTPEQAGFADILRRMRIVTQAPQIDSANRIAWSEASRAYWVDRQGQFDLENPKPMQSPLVETPAGQRHLISVVLDKTQSMPKREQASQIFVQSVKQFGLLISTETANAQYHEYNTRGPDEMSLRVVLGRVLDAIEASQGQKSWAEVTP